MDNWLVYPYHSSDGWIFKQNFNKRILSSVKAVLSSEDKLACMNEDKFIEVNDFKEEMKKSAGLWIRQSREDADFYKGILPKVNYAVKNGKQIFCSRILKREEEEELRSLVPKCQWIGDICKETEYTVKNTVFVIYIPVVLFTGVTKKINKLQQVLCIQRELQNKGYRAVVFSDAKEAELFCNCHWLSMFSSKEKTNSEKIILANHYVKQIEIDENPEVILIGMMEGTSTLGNECVEDFGVGVYSITQGVQPDCTVLNVMYGDYNQDELEQLGKEVSNITGGDVDFYNITGKVIDSVGTENTNEICTIELDKELIKKEIKRFNKANVFYTEEESENERLANAIVDKLADYADIISI